MSEPLYLWILSTPGGDVTEYEEPMTQDWSVCKKTKYVLQSKLDEAMAENGKLRVALLDMFKMIDEGMLVRDITKDGDEFWAFEMLKFVSRLNQARAVLSEGDKK